MKDKKYGYGEIGIKAVFEEVSGGEVAEQGKTAKDLSRNY